MGSDLEWRGGDDDDEALFSEDFSYPLLALYALLPFFNYHLYSDSRRVRRDAAKVAARGRENDETERPTWAASAMRCACRACAGQRVRRHCCVCVCAGGSGCVLWWRRLSLGPKGSDV